MIYVFGNARRGAIGRRGKLRDDFPQLYCGAKIVVVSSLGTLAPYEVLARPVERNGEWQVRLRHLLAGEIPGYSSWIQQVDNGYHGLANLGVVPRKYQNGAGHLHGVPMISRLPSGRSKSIRRGETLD